MHLAVLGDIFIWAEGAQHESGDNDCDTLGVRAGSKRVRLCVSLRIAQFGMFWSRDCTAGDVLVGVLCGIAQFRMFTLVVRFLAHPIGRSSAWTATSLSASLASNPRYRVSSLESTAVFPCSSCLSDSTRHARGDCTSEHCLCHWPFLGGCQTTSPFLTDHSR